MDSDYHCRVGDARYYKPSSKMKIPTQSTSKYFLFKSALFTDVQGSNKYRSWISLLLLVMITSTVRFQKQSVCLCRFEICTFCITWSIAACFACVFLFIYRYCNLFFCMYAMRLHLPTGTIFLEVLCLLPSVPMFTDANGFLCSYCSMPKVGRVSV